ncbi:MULTISPECIES: hypothetical protein [Sphingobium]|uniref:hypothetical protein n=1 Tax=Sphingobium TaxID=165695 RepID=UPI001112A476|nr:MULTISPECIES: hypothetical protein [Sphingobium]MCB4859041.1 hypothetical protein [Sphingobium sp. PNB]NML91071.1 hypothetical protein [Sphingobium sp. TB-6]
MEIAMSALPLVLILMLTGSLTATATAAEHHASFHVACAQGRSLGLRIEGRQARVQLADGELVLARKPSSLGRHFRSGDATLNLDDGFVAFARRGDWDWQDCHIDPSFVSER